MCGIIGYTGTRDAIGVIIEGLRRLEYRGYDSAGIAYLNGTSIEVKRCKGKIAELQSALCGLAVTTGTAIGHTRWATHGKPSEVNAHPHRSDGIIVVHNGIIENHMALKKQLIAEGYVFSSETDTEVICHLINKHSKLGLKLEDAVRAASLELKGAYAIAVESEAEPGTIVAVRKDSPLVVGIGDREYFVASDIPAFLSYTRDVVFLEDDEMVVMTPEGISFSTIQGKSVIKKPEQITWSASMAEKGGYKHFMLKEIFEQPRAIADTIAGRVNPETAEVNLAEFMLSAETLRSATRIFIVACGTSWHAGMIGKYMIEDMARLPVEVDIASEFRYRNPILKPTDLFISISQSGETADTLAAQRLAKHMGIKTISICNVIGSTASREADAVFYTRSGPEIGVASTKAFTTQIAGLFLLALAAGNARSTLSIDRAKKLVEELLKVPDKIETALMQNEALERIASELSNKDTFLYLGRGINFPIALEGALKLKEISYIHAEAYAAGEMKHGPIALIEDDYPVMFLVPKDALFEKVLSNMQEIRSRGGRIITVTTGGTDELEEFSASIVRVPECDPMLQPILLVIPLQLLAYHIGVLRGCDVDQPRNLAKSVTVE